MSRYYHQLSGFTKLALQKKGGNNKTKMLNDVKSHPVLSKRYKRNLTNSQNTADHFNVDISDAALAKLFIHPKRFLANYDYKVFTKTNIDKNMIVKNGAMYQDGFVGVVMKRESYKTGYHFGLDDGENKTIFFKRFERFPTKSELLLSVLYDFNCQVKG